MPLAAYTDLCIDAVDAPVATRFWAEVLGLDPHLQADGDGELRDQDGHVIVRVNGVAESKTVKNRVHIDVTTDDVDALLSHGATLLQPRGGELGWDVLADPDGNEFCAFTS